MSPTAIYNQINDLNKNDILNKFVDFVNACENDIPIQWAAAELNGIFLKNPDIRSQKKNVRQTYIPEALQELGNVIKEILEAITYAIDYSCFFTNPLEDSAIHCLYGFLPFFQSAVFLSFFQAKIF